MLNEKMQSAMNAQINAELYSAYMYYSMAAYLAASGLPGFAHWMNLQAWEEVTHAHKFANFINERGGRVELAPIEGPPKEWESPLAVMQAAYDHEVKVTGMINKLVDLAVAESDHASNNFLQWYVAEQVEEEASADEIVQKLKLISQSTGGMFMLDRELGQRQASVPPEMTGGA